MSNVDVLKIDIGCPELNTWLDYWNAGIVADFRRKGFTHKPPVVAVEWAKRTPGRLLVMFGPGSCTGIIDAWTGDIYASASYGRPAKHVRGNLFSERKGCEAISHTFYGIRMLR